MIIIVVGNIGSGKSLTIIKEIIGRGNFCHINFKVYGLPHNRIKWEHLIQQGEKKSDSRVNFGFWQQETKKHPFDIYLDEFHNVMSSRRSISKKNVLLSDWLSQIRKILGQSEKYNLYLLTQKLRRIDINSRDLAQCVILCQKQLFHEIQIPTVVIEKGKRIIKKLPLCVIYKQYFPDADSLSNFEIWGSGKPFKITRFIANDYYQYYDSYEIIDFGEGEYV